MTAKGRHARALAAVSEWCRRNRHLSLRDQHAHLSQMLRGHYAYYGISGNSRRIRWFNSVKRRTRVVRERAIEGEDRMLPKNEQSKPHEATTIPAAPVIMLTPAPEATVRPSSRISAAREAVREFLSTELGARETRITKIAPLHHGSEGWEAEAEILVPDLEVKMLNLPLTQEVFEVEHYAVELEADLSVRSYGPLGANEE